MLLSDAIKKPRKTSEQTPRVQSAAQVKQEAERLHQLELDLARAERHYVQVKVESLSKLRRASSDAEAQRIRSKYALLVDKYRDLLHQARTSLDAFHKEGHTSKVYDYARKTWGEV